MAAARRSPDGPSPPAREAAEGGRERANGIANVRIPQPSAPGPARRRRPAGLRHAVAHRGLERVAGRGSSPSGGSPRAGSGRAPSACLPEQLRGSAPAGRGGPSVGRAAGSGRSRARASVQPARAQTSRDAPPRAPSQPPWEARPRRGGARPGRSARARPARTLPQRLQRLGAERGEDRQLGVRAASRRPSGRGDAPGDPVLDSSAPPRTTTTRLTSVPPGSVLAHSRDDAQRVLAVYTQPSTMTSLPSGCL